MTGEIPLTGGWVTQGVVRIGETVRRPVGPNAEFVHRLLDDLARVGFAGAPRFLGIDDSGRAWKHLTHGLIDLSVGEQRRRLHVFVDAYGVVADGRLLRAIDAAQGRMQQLIERAADKGSHVALKQIEAERAWLRHNGSDLVD